MTSSGYPLDSLEIVTLALSGLGPRLIIMSHFLG
jgi:hypothetical protein